MHHTQALHTLLQCLEDLTGTINQFGEEHQLHEVEKDLLLYRSRLLYEAILALPTLTARQLEELSKINANLQEQLAKKPEKQVENADLAAATNVASNKETAEEKIASPEPQKTAAEVTPPTTSELADETAIKNTPTVDNEAANLEEENTVVSAEEEAEKPVENEKDAPQQLEATVSSLHLHVPADENKATVSYEQFSIKSVLQQSGDKDLILTHLKLKPIQDLKSGIGLNEKFLFIRELFGNDHQAYATAVSKLNEASDLQQAEALIAKELLPLYQWQVDDEAVVNFLHLILRRFSA